MAGTSGAKLEALGVNNRNTALIVVDVQNDFCHSQGVFSKYKKVDLEHVEQAVKNLAVFIDRCRQFNVPVIFIKTTHSQWTNSPSWLSRLEGKPKETGICAPDSWGSDFYLVSPREGDCVVTKHRYSAFVGTDLDLILRSRGIENIIVTGVATNVCVETTARDGFNHDYNVVLLDDCCGAFDQAEHEATLNNIRKFFGTVSDSITLIEVFQKQVKAEAGAGA
ncbi:MAG: cysteine hydrolase [Deltaproteobacteria bacterium]|nr:cysteine hydrolase [Deltaproteobacteria bacterium]